MTCASHGRETSRFHLNLAAAAATISKNGGSAAMTRIRFGVFDHIEHLPDVPLHRIYEERLQQMEALDQAGFFAYHLAEHHTPAVHSMAPSQNVFLSSAAQRTKRLRFGPGVYVLPLHHPLRLIEEVSMLDHLSGGRLELGVGRGGVLEAYFWGQDGDEASNRLRYDETLETVRRGLANDELTFEGRFYRFDQVPMRLRPLQQPTPPFWYMRNPEVAAEHGMNCIVVGSLDTLEANVMRYRRLWGERNPGPLTAARPAADDRTGGALPARPRTKSRRSPRPSPRRGLRLEPRHAATAGGRAQEADAVRERRGHRPAARATRAAHRAGRTARPRGVAGEAGGGRAQAARRAPAHARRPARLRGRNAGDGDIRISTSTCSPARTTWCCRSSGATSTTRRRCARSGCFAST